MPAWLIESLLNTGVVTRPLLNFTERDQGTRQIYTPRKLLGNQRKNLEVYRWQDLGHFVLLLNSVSKKFKSMQYKWSQSVPGLAITKNTRTRIFLHFRYKHIYDYVNLSLVPSPPPQPSSITVRTTRCLRWTGSEATWAQTLTKITSLPCQ